MSQREDASRPCPTLSTTYKDDPSILSLSCQLGADDQTGVFGVETSSLGHFSLSCSPAVVVLRRSRARSPLTPCGARGCREAAAVAYLYLDSLSRAKPGHGKPTPSIFDSAALFFI
jgi:hypothetical protein